MCEVSQLYIKQWMRNGRELLSTVRKLNQLDERKQSEAWLAKMFSWVSEWVSERVGDEAFKVNSEVSTYGSDK